MNQYIDAILQSVEDENWYSAIFMALTLPDICGWLDTPNTPSKDRYIAWCEKYITLCNVSNEKKIRDFFGPEFVWISSDDLYALRCSLLHEGVGDISRQRARKVLSKIMFTTSRSHCVLVDDVLMLAVSDFSKEICDGVASWETDTIDDIDIQERKKELLHVHTERFSPKPGHSVM